MEKLPMCRICLVENVRMYVVVNKNIHELYEKLTDVPFVTEDSRPMLACFFCCTKLKQCCRLLRKCLEAEEFFSQMLNKDYKPDPLINPGHLGVLNRYSNSQIMLISIVDGGQTVGDAIKKESPDVSERRNMDPHEEHQTDKPELENVDNSDEDTPALHAESDSDDVPLMDIKTEVEELIEPEMENVDNSDEEDTPALHAESDSDDVPLMKIKSEVKEFIEIELENVEDTPALHAESDSDDVPLMEIKIEVEEFIGAPVAKNPKQDTRCPRDTISAEQKKNENNRKLPCVSKIINTTQNHTSERITKFKEPFAYTKPEVNKSINNCHINSNKDYIKCKLSKKNMSSDDIQKYRRVCVIEKRFKCDICQHSFSKNSDLTKHTRIHTGEKPFKCDFCQGSFKRKCHLEVHIRTHTGEKPFKCGICQRGFSQNSLLTRHVRVHTGEKPFKCDICQSSFNRKINLDRHILVHSGDKPFKCEICQRSFKLESHLSKHIRVHTGEKPFKCEICEQSFNRKSHVINHIRIHTDEKPFKCDKCQSSFNRKTHLTYHIRTHK